MGTPLPKSLADAPILVDAYQINLQAAFWKLSTCREVGMSIGPIRWDAIDRFAKCHGYDDDEIEYETFVYLIIEMDGVFMEHAQSDTGSGGSGGKSSSVRKTVPAHRGRRR
jgi:hypothetical protein